MNKLVVVHPALPAHVAHDRVVQRLQEAETALGYAVEIDQVRLVMDVAAAQEVFAKRQQTRGGRDRLRAHGQESGLGSTR
jgi:hypothetical protein